jgi:hypothetical protein
MVYKKKEEKHADRDYDTFASFRAFGSKAVPNKKSCHNHIKEPVTLLRVKKSKGVPGKGAYFK